MQSYRRANKVVNGMHTINNGTFVSVPRYQRYRAIEGILLDVHACSLEISRRFYACSTCAQMPFSIVTAVIVKEFDNTIGDFAIVGSNLYPSQRSASRASQFVLK